MTPPRLAERLLLRRLGADERDEVIGDLQEQFAARCASGGEAAARRWYWRQAVALLWGFSVRRRDLVARTHERVRGRWALGNLALDVRYAWRAIRHSPSFALVVLAMLTVGIGVSTAVFSLVGGILLDPLPYPHAHRLVRISESSTGDPVVARGEWAPVRTTSLGAWVDAPTALSHISPYITTEIVVSLPDGVSNLNVSRVGGQFFGVLGIKPLAGRLLQPSENEPAAALVAVISERLAWRSFGGPEAAIGKGVGLETRTHIVVGVLPRTFVFPASDVDIWQPGPEFWRLPAPGERRTYGSRAQVIALLREGASLADAQAQGERVGQALALAELASGGASVETPRFRITRLLDDLVAPIRPALLILTGGMVIVLMALIVTLANLLLARGSSRQRELAVRLTLGAGRWRVGQPVIIELLMLSLGGSAAGGALAWWLLRVLPAFAPANVPRIESIHFDGRAMLFAVVALIATTVLVGWLPLLQMGAVNVSELTPAGARVRIGRMRSTGERLRGILVVAQVALAVVLLVAALLIGRSFATLMNVDLGYEPAAVLTFEPVLTFNESREPGRLRSYYTELLRRLNDHPSIQSAGTASVLPLHSIKSRSSVAIVGRPRDPKITDEDMAIRQPISLEYLRTIGTRVVAGRGFNSDDRAAGQPVVLVDEVLVRRFFPDGNAIGQQIKSPRANLTIVGVVEAMRVGALGEDPLPVTYFPADQMPEFLAFYRAGVAVRGHGDPRALEPIVRQIAKEVDPRVPLHNVRPLADAIRGNVAQPRFFTIVLVLFAGLALSTALLGIYGVLAYAVERRRQEFGIRRALGAAERHVVALVVGRGLALAAAGAVLGLAAAAICGEFLRSVLFGITPGDPLSFAGAAGLVIVMALLASWQPVRRALRIDPARALRMD